MEAETFWMVWCPQGSAPTHRHSSQGSAVTEAERLARTQPGREFYVLQAIEGRCMDGMQRVKLAELPF